jgi:uncharacterized protein (DUF2062 family)
MPRHLIKRYAPDQDVIRNHKHLRMFGRLLHDPNLWHLNRRSVSGALAVGLFWAFIPIPFQMVAAAATAIPTRVNLPLSVVLVWITNPVTMPAMFYFNYVVGTWILGSSGHHPETAMTMEYLVEGMAQIWRPLFCGSLLCGAIAAVIGYFAMRLLWRFHVLSAGKKRRQRRKESAAGGSV